MKFSSTDKISETVSLIRNKKIYFIGRNECIIKKKIECWPFFKQDPIQVISWQWVVAAVERTAGGPPARYVLNILSPSLLSLSLSR